MNQLKYKIRKIGVNDYRLRNVLTNTIGDDRFLSYEEAKYHMWAYSDEDLVSKLIHGEEEYIDRLVTAMKIAVGNENE